MPDGFHLSAEAGDEMHRIRRKRSAAFYRDEGVETCWLADFKKPHPGNVAMRHRELIDDGDAETGLHQGANGIAEASADGDVVGQFVAREQVSHDAAVGVGRLDAD